MQVPSQCLHHDVFLFCNNKTTDYFFPSLGVACSLHEAQTNDGKIVGGTETSIQNYPYQVYLLLKQTGTNKYFECGGSIATQYCILTAAHCLTG